MIKIPLCEPNLNGNEAAYLKKCIDSGWVSSAGSFLEKFEQSISQYTQFKYSTAVVNGTAALHLSLLVSGIQQNDEVLVPSLTFIAPINAIRYIGAIPVFMDCDRNHGIDLNKTLEFLEKETTFIKGKCFNKKTKRRIAAILPVNVWGTPVNLLKINDLCKRKNIRIIEDASESLGSFYLDSNGNSIHSGQLSDIACISFNGNKIITSGGGGMVLTNNKKFSDLTKYLSAQAKDNPLYYIHNQVGFNYRLTNIQAALGLAQFEQLESFKDRKASIHEQYLKGFSENEDFKIIPAKEGTNPNHWISVLKITNKATKKKRDSLLKKLLQNGIESRPVWYPNHLQKAFIAFQTYKVKRTTEEVNSCICLPSSTNLKVSDINKVIKTILS